VVEAGTLAASKEREHSMKGDQFIAEVRNLADLASTEEAEKATRATLEILRERIAGNEPSNLAAQLPPEVASYAEDSGSGESFSVEEFYDRFAQREGVDRDAAVRAACGSRGAEVVTVPLLRSAHVQSHPHPKGTYLLAFRGEELPLGLQGRLKRIRGSMKGTAEGVTDRLEDVTTSFLYSVPQDLIVADEG
jgi:uncharacterized protein (DUF2267 family)